MKKDSNEIKKVRTLRISDRNYEQLRKNAETANLSLSDYIVMKGLEEQQSIPQDILCRLEAIHNIMVLPLESLNDTLKSKYEEDIKIVCARLFW